MNSKTHVPGERLYRVLLGCYPKQFRERYKSELLHTFRDLRQEQHQSPLSFWGYLLTDLLVSLSREHLRNISRHKPRIQPMKLPSNLTLFSLILGISLFATLVYIAMQPNQTADLAVITVQPSKHTNETPTTLNSLLNNETLMEVAHRLNLQEQWKEDNETPLSAQEITKKLRQSITISPIRMTDMLRIEAISIETELAQKIISELLRVAEEKNTTDQPRWKMIQSNTFGGIPGPDIAGLLTTGSIAGAIAGGFAIILFKRYDIQVSCRRRSKQP